MKTRFAPSPTGPFHIGGLRTALLSKVIAEKMGGDSVLRIEDTDVARSTPEYEKTIIDGLAWCNLDFGPPCFRQSQRMTRYELLIQKLLDSGDAYYCYMTSSELESFRQEIRDFNQSHPTSPKKLEKYDNRFRPENWPNGIPAHIKQANPNPVIRLKMPTEGITQWNDLAKGGIAIPNQQLDDLIISRSDGSPTYNFVVVVDDLDSHITHVIRGEDHINNTPKQIQIAKILRQLPDNQFPQTPIVYCHIPLMFNPDGSKISKSALADPKNQEKVKNGLVVPAAVDDYKNLGILPDALINYLLLISSQKTVELINTEIFNKQTFIKNFDFSHLSKKNAQFDFNKLKEINFHYIQQLSPDSFLKVINDFNPEQGENLSSFNYEKISSHIQQRSKTLDDSCLIISNLSVVKKNILESSDLDVLKLSSCKTDVEFKDKMKELSQEQGIKVGEFAKNIREKLHITCGLSLFEIFNDLTPTSQPKKRLI